MLFSLVLFLNLAVFGQTAKVIKTENKPDEIVSWIDLQGFQGNYQVFVHYTYDFKTWGDVSAGTVNIQSDQQIGIRMPKSCFSRDLMFWNFKLVKH